MSVVAADWGMLPRPRRLRRGARLVARRRRRRASPSASSRCRWRLAFGITTGLGAPAGLITAIVAGLVAAVFGGSNVQVSGPTGAMTVVLVPVVARYGADAVYVVGMHGRRAGRWSPRSLRLGRFLAYIPWPVIEGFTVGIAVIIFLQQVPAALGVAKPDGENTAAVAVRAPCATRSAASATGRCARARRARGRR